MQIITLSFVKYFQLRVVIKNINERKENFKKRKIVSNSNNFFRSPVLARVLTFYRVAQGCKILEIRKSIDIDLSCMLKIRSLYQEILFRIAGTKRVGGFSFVDAVINMQY